MRLNSSHPQADLRVKQNLLELYVTEEPDWTIIPADTHRQVEKLRNLTEPLSTDAHLHGKG